MTHTFQGCYTALATPMDGDGGVDFDGLQRLIDFQIAGGVAGVLACGTTGESPTLTWDEHNAVIERTCHAAGGSCIVIAGTGSNSVAESMESTAHAVEAGADAVLLVEPYYNGPSSIEIRREYMAPVARRFPAVQVIPYVIPGRSGTQILPADLALLRDECENVRAVKEASGDLDNMRRTRDLCGPQFAILSGDDAVTARVMADDTIAGAGVISVVSNVVPAAVQRMAAAFLAGDRTEGGRLATALEPFFDIVTVKTTEDSAYGPRLCKARNPLAVKTLMNLLGMPAGPVRAPLGRMTQSGLGVVVDAARRVWNANPELLEPIADAFGADLEQRLSDPSFRTGLAYED